jgi:uncharacterized protein YegL
MSRRLPVYLLLDCSESMAGNSLDRVEAGVMTMLASLKRNPYALETVHLCIITFDVKARVVTPLTELMAVRPPNLSIKPGTSLGAALDLLSKCLDKDLVKTTPSHKGDYKPLVFILTDGQPTDEWLASLKKVRAATPHVASIVTIGCGDEVDFETLSKIGDACYSVKDFYTESIGKLFLLLTASVQSNSTSPDDKGVSLAKIPPSDGMIEIDLKNPPKLTGGRTRLFIHVTCSKTRKPYLLVYERLTDRSGYICREALPLPEDFFSEGTLKSPPISDQELLNILPCPICEADGMAKCSFCSHLFCLSADSAGREVTCPCCETVLTGSTDSSSFSIDGSAG